MGFLSGRATFSRLRVTGSPPGTFSEDHLHRLAAHAAGKQKRLAADGVSVGWTAGDHILDTSFDLEKNLVNDALHFTLRIDVEQIPADLQRAYFQIELKALSRGNPSGNPSARQKREARAAAKERLAEEAKDGRFIRRKAVELLWDGPSNELLVASPSMAVLDRLYPMFEQTFGLKFEPITAGTLAFTLAETRQQSRGVDDAEPSSFVPGNSKREVAWIADDTSRDFLGNEFLLWLWYLTDSEEDTVKLADKSEVAIMLARTLALECPRGQTGKETISSDGPTRLPEARRAVQSGKLPRKCGITLVRHDAQYELSLQAETLAVGAAKLPPPEEESARARLEERVTRLRHLIETLDLLYDAYTTVRCGAQWAKEVAKLQKWLKE